MAEVHFLAYLGLTSDLVIDKLSSECCLWESLRSIATIWSWVRPISGAAWGASDCSGLEIGRCPWLLARAGVFSWPATKLVVSEDSYSCSILAVILARWSLRFSDSSER